MAKTTSPKPNLRVRKLDAPRREANEPDGFGLELKGNVYEFPSELPVDTFDPFLADEFDVVDLIRTIAPMMKDKERDTIDLVLDVINARPNLHRETFGAIGSAMRLLLGDDQYSTFKASRPSLQDYGRIILGLFDEYGVDLGEAFASVMPSTTGGPTQKQTSDESTESTSETPSSTPADQPDTD